MKIKNQYLKYIFFLSWIILTITAIISYKSITSLLERYNWVKHTQEVLIKVELVSSSLRECETNVRGYLLTHDQQFLDSYKSTQTLLGAEYLNLVHLTRDNDNQQKNLKKLDGVIQGKYRIFHKQIFNLNNKQEYAPLTLQGKKLTGDAWKIFDRIQTEEERLLVERTRDLDLWKGTLSVLLLAGFAIGFILTGLAFYLMTVEVTRREQTEKELREKDKTIEKIREFEFLADTLPQLIWTANPDGNIDYTNKNWLEFLNESEKWKWEDLIHPEEKDRFSLQWLYSVSSGEKFGAEFRMKKMNEADYRWYLFRAKPLKNESGEIIKWFGTCTDIQDQKESEEKIKEANDRFRLVVEGVKDYAIFVIDTKGIIKTWNSGAEQILKYSSEEVIGQYFSTFYTQELIDKGMPARELEVTSMAGRYEEEGWRKRKDGSLIWVNVVVSALYDNAGMLIGFSKIIRDLTERKLSEEKLKQQNEELEKFRSMAVDELKRNSQVLEGIITNIKVGLFSIDPDGLLVHADGKSWVSHVIENKVKEGENIYTHFPEWKPLFASSLSTGRGVLTKVNNEGKEHYFENYIIPDVVNQNGIIGFALDVTERTLAEINQRETQGKFQAIFNQTFQFMWLLHPDGTLVEANETALVFAGTTLDEVCGKIFWETPWWSDSLLKQERLRHAVAEAASGKLVRYEEENTSDYGHTITIDFSLKPAYDEVGKVKWLIPEGRDVSINKLIQKKMIESEQRFKGLLELAPDSIVIVNEKGRIVLINKQTELLFGYTSEELIGKNIERLIPEKFAKNHHVFVSQYNEAPDIKEIGLNTELFARKKDGSEFSAEISLSPFTTKDGTLVFAIVRDVTKRKEAEKELEKAKLAAESANSFKSQFLANMTHEIRTPLNAILGFSNILKDQNLNAQQNEFLDYISSSGNILLKLIGDILDLNKIEEGKLELVKETFFLKDVISSSIMPYKYKANEKGLEFELLFHENVPHYVVGDNYRINQIIINLIGNAIKFTKEGKIQVSVINLSPEKFGQEAVLKFTVSDTGIGISKEKQEAVFESFTQADSTIVREFGGSGLGLSIVKQLVEMMDGKLEVKSPSMISEKGGPGTSISFIIKLPVDTSFVKPAMAGTTQVKLPQIPEESKILIVEDNMVNRRLAKAVFKKLGASPDFAENGQEAVDIVRTTEYSIIFMDVQMPVMDGYQATKVIRTELGSDVPVIGLTANVFKEDIENCFASGMNDYLAKPYNEIQISNMVTKWIK